MNVRPSEVAGRRYALGEVLRLLVGVLLAGLVGRTFLLAGLLLPCRVDSASMEPTLAVGERILVDRTACWFRDVQRWDVVVLQCPEDPRALCVKRVAGLPGEQIQLREGTVYADGVPQPAVGNWRYGARRGMVGGTSQPYVLGEDELFLLGDNSAVSVDSRVWNPFAVPRRAIIGLARRYPLPRRIEP